jgi:hypothetical protein
MTYFEVVFKTYIYIIVYYNSLLIKFEFFQLSNGIFQKYYENVLN